jgi:cyclophilin family peptidyl-prolyl cis-trans isomerase
MKRSPLFAAVVYMLALGVLEAVPEADGLYAIFRTSEGEFTVELDFEKVPMTVANFVTLAEGTRSWLDLTTGQVRADPYYDGLVFHRVIENFMIQGGSRNGMGTDNPGYRFADEFFPGLVHSTAGVLSMANSGPDSNGGQFFVTVAPTPWLDYKHSVFGRIVQGLDRAVAISQVPTGAQDKPIKPVVLEEVEIVRQGAAATAFDGKAYALPEVKAVGVALEEDGDGLFLKFPQSRYHEYHVFRSGNWADWIPNVGPFRFAEPTDTTVDVTAWAAGRDRLFFRTSAIDYGYVASSVRGKRLVLNLAASNQELALDVTGERPKVDPDAVLGTGTLDGGAGLSLWDYIWEQDRHVGRMLFLLGGLPEIHAHLKFLTDGHGTFTGMAYPAGGSFPIYGTFSLDDL